MWRWFWRLIGLAALILSALCCFFLYTLWKASDIQAVAAGKPVGNSLDVISLQIDILSITMAAVGIGLGVVGLIGYQSMKDGALEQASRVAEKVATDAASRHMENKRKSVEGLKSGDVHQVVEATTKERKRKSGVWGKSE